MSAKQYYQATGRRKEAIATARLSKGEGQITVNQQPVEEYFSHDHLSGRLRQPLVLLGRDKDFDVSLKVAGGGLSGQADASRLAISKALTVMDEELRPTLKKAGLLSRDARVKERKKYGLKRARKAPQFTKR